MRGQVRPSGRGRCRCSRASTRCACSRLVVSAVAPQPLFCSRAGARRPPARLAASVVRRLTACHPPPARPRLRLPPRSRIRRAQANFRLRITSLSSHRDRQRFRVRVTALDAQTRVPEPGLSAVTKPMKCVTKLATTRSSVGGGAGVDGVDVASLPQQFADVAGAVVPGALPGAAGFCGAGCGGVGCVSGMAPNMPMGAVPTRLVLAMPREQAYSAQGSHAAGNGRPAQWGQPLQQQPPHAQQQPQPQTSDDALPPRAKRGSTASAMEDDQPRVKRGSAAMDSSDSAQMAMAIAEAKRGLACHADGRSSGDGQMQLPGQHSHSDRRSGSNEDEDARRRSERTTALSAELQRSSALAAPAAGGTAGAPAPHAGAAPAAGANGGPGPIAGNTWLRDIRQVHAQIEAELAALKRTVVAATDAAFSNAGAAVSGARGRAAGQKS